MQPYRPSPSDVEKFMPLAKMAFNKFSALSKDSEAYKLWKSHTNHSDPAAEDAEQQIFYKSGGLFDE